MEIDWSGSWAWEIGGAILSFICLGLLMGFLGYVGGMSYTKWQYYVSPNAVISIITTFMKASMLVPLSACLGQLKWRQDAGEKPTPLYLLMVPEGHRGNVWPDLAFGTPPSPDYRAVMMANWTLYPTKKFPDPQIYFLTFGMSDTVVMDALITFYEMVGWMDLARTYRDKVTSY